MKKKIGLSLLVLLGIVGLTGCGNNTDDSKKYHINVNADENIAVETYVDHDKDYLIVYMTNNNDYNIGSIDMKATFYDNNGNNVGDDSNTLLDFVSGGKYVFTVDLPHDDDYNNYVPEKIDLSIKVDEEYQDYVGGGTLYNDKISTNYTKNGDEIQVSIKNNSGVELYTVEVAVLFMKNGKPIYVDHLSGSLDIGETETESIDIPEYWEASENSDEDVLIDFDSVEFVVNRASAE